MAAASALLDYLIDQLAPLGDVRGCGMFGGYGLYLNGAIVGIVIDETLYLKVDAGNRADFEKESMSPFTYLSKGRRVALSYWEAPAAVIEEPDELHRWVAGSAAAAGGTRLAKARRSRKPRRRSSP